MPDHGVDELARTRFQALRGNISQRLNGGSEFLGRFPAGACDARLIFVQSRHAPDKVRVAVHKAGHYDMPCGIDLLAPVRQREVLDTPAEAHFHDAPVFDDQRAIANDAEFLQSGATSGLRRAPQRDQLPGSPHKKSSRQSEDLGLI